MKKSLELTYEMFKSIIKKKMEDQYGNIKESGEWELKIDLSNDMCLKIELKDAWNQYEKTNDINVLLEFIRTQSDILMSLNSKNKTLDDIKSNLLPTIRSKDFLNKIKANDSFIQKTIGKNLNSVILYDQERYTQIVYKNLYPTPLSDEEVFAIAVDNLKNRGWVDPSQKFEEDSFELLIFEEKEHNSHYQFFIREWIDKIIGDCYIAFPTNKIAFVMKLKNDNWRDWIKCLNFFSKTVRKTYSEEAYPLSDSIIKYENGKYDVL